MSYYSGYSGRKSDGNLITFAVCAIFLIILLLIKTFVSGTYTVTVTDKDIKNYKNDSKYLIYCRDENNEVAVFENEDTIIFGKFNSSDIYADIEIGAKYKFTTRGPRVPVLSMYPNIIKYELIKEENENGE